MKKNLVLILITMGLLVPATVSAGGNHYEDCKKDTVSFNKHQKLNDYKKKEHKCEEPTPTPTPTITPTPESTPTPTPNVTPTPSPTPTPTPTVTPTEVPAPSPVAKTLVPVGEVVELPAFQGK